MTYLPALYHIREGKVRNIGHERMDLEAYVAREKWREIGPSADFLGPFSPLGSTLAVLGSLGYTILSGVEAFAHRIGIDPNWILGLLIMLTIMGVYAAVLLRKSVAAAERPAAKGGRADKED